MKSKNRLTQLHPEIEEGFFETYESDQVKGDWRNKHTIQVLNYLDRLIDITPPQKIAVTGCGPVPETIRTLKSEGYEVTGIEPIPEYVKNANKYLEEENTVVKGWCESIPAEDNSFDIIFCKSVLEHVDSPEKSLDEFFRILKPGGVVYIATENRHRFSIVGRNSEFSIPFYNWFPRAVKEGYVNKHLHVNPKLAAYTPIPAVHWYTFAELCRLGRYAGFGKFYSLLDVIRPEDPKVNSIPLAKYLINLIKKSPWLRAFALSQRGGSTIFMYKREK